MTRKPEPPNQKFSLIAAKTAAVSYTGVAEVNATAAVGSKCVSLLTVQPPMSSRRVVTRPGHVSGVPAGHRRTIL